MAQNFEANLHSSLVWPSLLHFGQYTSGRNVDVDPPVFNFVIKASTFLSLDFSFPFEVSSRSLSDSVLDVSSSLESDSELVNLRCLELFRGF